MQWLKSGDLVLESEVLNDAWGRAASKITIGFDQENRASIRNVEPEKMSIVDYFLLLPADQFEDGSPSRLLQNTRTGGGQLYLCDAEPPDKYVHEKNGYMSCIVDGGQPQLDVALFRHRDGRPLLAVCSGDSDGFDSIYLHFFELGADGKMHKIKRSIFPIADSPYEAEKDKPNWQFELPREGRTILVRTPKGGKLLHKITWNGETFEKQK
jgi:hypothetical protein